LEQVTQRRNIVESVKNFLAVFSDILEVEDEPLGTETPLLSGEKPIDSVALVEICVRLEDYALELGFEFDWTSENAMSRSRGAFATVGTLYEEFMRQRDVKTG